MLYLARPTKESGPELKGTPVVDFVLYLLIPVVIGLLLCELLPIEDWHWLKVLGVALAAGALYVAAITLIGAVL